jgi:hypothetical protein
MNANILIFIKIDFIFSLGLHYYFYRKGIADKNNWETNLYVFLIRASRHVLASACLAASSHILWRLWGSTSYIRDDKM